MIEKMLGGAVEDIVLDTIVDRVNELKASRQWEKLFAETNEFILTKVDNGDLLLGDIAVLLSGDDIRQLARDSKQESKFKLRDKLHQGLKSVMMRYEIPANEADFYITSFISMLLHELEKTNPEIAQAAFLGDWRKEEEANLTKIKESLKELRGAVMKIQEKRVSVYTIDQTEIQLLKESILPYFSLDFFSIDDELFVEEFEAHLIDENIYISGKCKEEIIYGILNELRRTHPNKVVLVIRNEEDWKKLSLANEQNPELGGKILIPWFYAEQIISVPNNTNVFVFGEDDNCIGKDCIEIRKRKESTVLEKLKEAGVEYEEAYRLIQDTHGLYIPLKKKIIRGIDTVDPQWVNRNINVVIPLLLCGKWTEREGDILVLEDMCGTKYEKIIDAIRPYTMGENPLFVRFKMHGNTIFHLASTENAWDYFDDFVQIGNPVWNKFVDMIMAIILEEDPTYSDQSLKSRYAYLFNNGKMIWSNTLKEGLLRSLIMKAYYKKKAINQSAIDCIIEKVLNEVNTVSQWLSLSKMFPTLCEASPKAVIQKLDMEWEHPTGLVDVFLNAKDEGIFSRNEYVHIIWGIEQFLCQSDYAAWAIRWFIKLNGLRDKYPISNSPDETLKRIFCSWYNVTVLTQKAKNEIAYKAFDDGYDLWTILYGELPIHNRTMILNISQPKYRPTGELVKATNGDVIEARNEYFDLCMKHMDYSVERWKKVFDEIGMFSEKEMERIYSQFAFEAESLSPEELLEIKECIRHEIYNNRFFCDSGWAMNEGKLHVLQTLLEEIKITKEEYEYRYLFGYSHDFPLLYPYPYESDNEMQKNAELAEKEIEEKIAEFKSRGLNVVELAKICCKKEYSTLGHYLFIYYCGKKFDEDLFESLLLDREASSIAIRYAESAYRNDISSLKTAIGIAKRYEGLSDILVSLLKIEVIDSGRGAFIFKEGENIKKEYWNSRISTRFTDDRGAIEQIITEMLKYANQAVAIDILYKCKDFLNKTEILSVLEKVPELVIDNRIRNESYHLASIINDLQDAFLFSKECKRVALLEITYIGLLEVEDMKCFSQCLKESPEKLIDIVSIIFKDDDGNTCEGNAYSAEQISSVFSLYYNIKFCPAENKGKVDKEKLYAWIEELKEGLNRNKQMRVFTMLLGHYFAYSPIGEDDLYPAEAIRYAIEDYGDATLENEYVSTIYNMRGVYSPSGGKEERKLANSYKENANGIRNRWYKSAKIYDSLHERYMYEADSERESEEYAGV